MISRALFALILAAAQPSPQPSLSPSPSPPPAPSVAPNATAPPAVSLPALVVRGQMLAIANGYFIFTSGDALRIASGLVVPAGVKTGSYVRIAIDQLTRRVEAIELEPKVAIPGEIEAAKLPREYVVVSPASAPSPAASAGNAGAAGAPVTITILVHVPANTPVTDDVYLATDRSAYSPTEIRMDRIDSTTFSTSIGIATGTVLKYQFTRGSYTTVERERDGSEVPAHAVVAAPAEKTSDTVARWADLP